MKKYKINQKDRGLYYYASNNSSLNSYIGSRSLVSSYLGPSYLGPSYLGPSYLGP